LWAVVPFSILNISHLAAGFKKKTQYAFWQSDSGQFGNTEAFLQNHWLQRGKTTGF
jgi:hypothetical protein